MFVVTGITGQVGGAVARTLLAAGRAVRAVVRDQAKAAVWEKAGCEIAIASMNDLPALTRAFEHAEGVFVLLPPNFDPSPGFPEACEAIGRLKAALAHARPPRVVCLSTVGAHAKQDNLLSQLGLMERELSGLAEPGMAVTFLRAAWFMENAAWDIGPARDTGVIPAFLQPPARAIPMVATADVGRVAAELLQAGSTGLKVVELEGPERVSPDDIAACLARLLERDVRVNAVPRDTWEPLFRSQGANNPVPRIQMLDGFNEGWLSFERVPLRGEVRLEATLASLVERAAGR